MAEDLKTADKDIDALLEALMSFKNKSELLQFLEDLLTIKELEEFGHRFAVARLLEQGRIYTDIEKVTGASSATISRVNRALIHGAGGYKKAIQYINSK